MSFESRMRWGVGLALAGLLILAGMGCSQNEDTEDLETTTADVAAPSSLADYTATLAEGVSLPAGCYPLAGHYSLDNESDQYDGWPRFIVSEADEMVMVYVPAQVFRMGGGLNDNSVPQRSVIVNHFYIDIHEVTNAQFSKFHKKTAGMGQSADPDDSFGRYWVPGLNDSDPVRNVTWFEADDYSRHVGRQLPTEAQWEAAARGSDQRIYPWGDEEQSDLTRYLCNAKTDLANYDGHAYVAPAMNYSAGVSPFGAFNMAGNVSEWCSDWYDAGRYAYPSSEDPATAKPRGAKPFGDENYPDPITKIHRASRVGPMIGSQRVIRGGSYAAEIEQCRVETRAAAIPGTRQSHVGFRCVLPLPVAE